MMKARRPHQACTPPNPQAPQTLNPPKPSNPPNPQTLKPSIPPNPQAPCHHMACPPYLFLRLHCRLHLSQDPVDAGCQEGAGGGGVWRSGGGWVILDARGEVGGSVQGQGAGKRRGRVRGAWGVEGPGTGCQWGGWGGRDRERNRMRGKGKGKVGCE